MIMPSASMIAWRSFIRSLLLLLSRVARSECDADGRSTWYSINIDTAVVFVCVVSMRFERHTRIIVQ